MARVALIDPAKFESLKKDDIGNVVLKFSTDKLNLTFISPDKQGKHIKLNELQGEFTKERNIIIDVFHPYDKGDDDCAKGYLHLSDDKTLVLVNFRDDVMNIDSIRCNTVIILPNNL